jgi:hypothetical protein
MPGYDFSKSNLFLMVGGQIMLLVLVIMVVWFGVGPLQFAYADQMRNMLNIVPSAIPSAIPSVNATSAIPSANATSVKPSANGIK